MLKVILSYEWGSPYFKLAPSINSPGDLSPIGILSSYLQYTDKNNLLWDYCAIIVAVFLEGYEFPHSSWNVLKVTNTEELFEFPLCVDPTVIKA